MIPINVKKIYLFWLVTLIITGYLSITFFYSFHSNPERYNGFPPFYRWDSGWYASIAREGYSFSNSENSNIAFFPLYPILIKITHEITKLNYSWAGFLISIIFSFFSFAYFYKLLRLDYSAKESFNTVIFWLFFPSAFFLISVYADSMFVFFSILSFYWARQINWAKSLVAASLLILIKPFGIFILPALILEKLIQDNWSIKSFFKQKTWILFVLPVVSFSLFLAYNFFEFGTALAFVQAQKTFGREFIWPFHPFLAYFYEIINFQFLSKENFHFLLNFAALLFFCIAFLISYRKNVRYSYLLFSLLIVFSAITGGTFISLNRYLLSSFPIFIGPSIILAERKTQRNTYLIISAILLYIFTNLFTRWFPIY